MEDQNMATYMCSRSRSDISEFTDQCRSLLIFVHVFSGYRRHGDLQSWIEKEVAGDGWRIYIVHFGRHLAMQGKTSI